MPTSPKPKHQAVFGRVRINLFGGAGPERHKPVNVTLERRRDDQTEEWYPAAGFKVEELPSLEQAARSIHEFLTHPNGKASAKAASPVPKIPPSPESKTTPAASEPKPEEPPFTPNRPANSPPQIRPAVSPPASPSESKPSPKTPSPSRSPKPKPKPSAIRAAGRKVKTRSR